MKKHTTIVLLIMAACAVAPVAYAQGTPPVEAPLPWWIAVSAAFGMAIASAGCAYAQAKATAAACESFARNPGASAVIRFTILLALILIESMALYTFAIIYLKVK